ncbi:MAG: hypothetical protein J7J98_04995 [candidate division Zixibacteria bacterium]|nr:hypothetical protein [candidate division Zixibacteria bacterium]
MLKRSMIPTGMILLTALTLILTGPGCSNNEDDTPATVTKEPIATADSVAITDINVPAGSHEQFIVTPSSEKAANLLLKRQEIFSWAYKQVDRLENALKDVTKIIMFSNLGLGDQLYVTLPRRSEGWPVGNSIRLKLNAHRTALALRFVVDTLPGDRVWGEGILGIFAVHCSDNLGRNIDIGRTQSNTGRLDLVFRFEQIATQLNCCDLPPTFMLDGFGDIGDTLSMIITFDRTLGQYMTTLVGPKHGRSYGARSYVNFRTERGEFHKDMKEYPYFYETSDPGWVNLFLGSHWRGKKMSTEPILTARIF